MRRKTLRFAVIVAALTLLSFAMRMTAQERSSNPPPPAPIHGMPDLPPLPEPVNPPPPAPSPRAPDPFPVVTRDVPPAAPAPTPPAVVPVVPASPAETSSSFASTPRSNDPAPGRPPAFRLLGLSKRGEPELMRSGPAAAERSADIPVVTTASTPLLSVEKRGPEAVTLGQAFVYEIVVRNTGTVPATQVRVEDEFPPGSRVLGAEPVGTVAGQGGRLSWVVDNLAAGAERHFKVRVQPAAAGDWRGNATASVLISSSSSLQTRVTPAGAAAPATSRVVPASLTIAQSGPDSVAMGHTAVFQIRITNHGSQPLKGLVLRDHVPPGLQHPAGPELEAELGTLEPGKTRNVTLTTQAVQPGRFINDAIVITGDGQQAEARAAIQIVGAARPQR